MPKDELIGRRGGIHTVLRAIESALSSEWLIGFLLGVLVATDRLDWLTGFVLCLVYVNLKPLRATERGEAGR